MKSYAKISLAIIVSWIKIGLVGILFSVVCLSAGIFLLIARYSPDKGLGGVFSSMPFVVALILFSVIAAVLYFVLAKKAAVMTAINLVWKNKLSDFIMPKIESYIQRFSEKQPDWLAGITNSRFAYSLVDCIAHDKTINKVQRTVLRFGVKNIELDSNDFDSVALLSKIVTSKIESKIQSYTKPSNKIFWSLIAIQLILLILVFVFYF